MPRPGVFRNEARLQHGNDLHFRQRPDVYKRQVLGLLKNEDKITEVQYQAALAEPIATRTPQSRSCLLYTSRCV